MDTLWQPLRRAVLALRRRPVYTLVTVLCLALGLGTTTTIFTILAGIVLEELPYEEPAELVVPWNRSPEAGEPLLPFSEGELLDFRQRAGAFRDAAGLMGWPFVLTGTEAPEEVSGARVSAGFFSVLGVSAAHGRTFAAQEDAPGGESLVILGHDLWQRLFAGDPGAVGRNLELDGQPHTIVGVMPAGFFYGDDYALWTPLVVRTDWQMPRDARAVKLIARLAPGVTLARAQASMADLVRGFRDEHPDVYPDAWGIYLRSLEEEIVGPARPGLLALQAVALLVLLLALANVAQLLLARAIERDGEMALRTALGAGRGSLVAAFLGETLLLAVLGGGLGLLLASAAVRLLVRLRPDGLPRLDGLDVGRPALALAVFLVLLAGLGFGALLGIRAWRRHRRAPLAGSSGRRVSARGRARGLLVASEVALALLVSYAAGLLLHSLLALGATDPGFESRDRLTFQLYLPRSAYPETPRAAEFLERLVEDLRALPGARNAAGVFDLPLGGIEFSGAVRLEDQPLPPGRRGPSVGWRTVTDGYFETLGIPLRAGRDFDGRDVAGSPAVVIIDEAMARRHWPGRDPLGRRLALADWADGDWMTIVGVVGAVRQERLDRPPTEQLYMPLRQQPRRTTSIVIHAQGDPLALSEAARQRVWALDPDRPVTQLRSVDQVLAAATSSFRLNATFFSVLAALALLLVILGIYGVTRHSLAERARELGIRTALGARRRDLLRRELGRVLRLALLGGVPGLVAAIALARALTSMLYGVAPGDPGTLLTVLAVVLLLVLAAAVRPIWTATGGDPMTVLRRD